MCVSNRSKVDSDISDICTKKVSSDLKMKKTGAIWDIQHLGHDRKDPFGDYQTVIHITD